MKKFFLLAMTLVLICSALFADDVSKTANAQLSLNLAGKQSIVHVGFVNGGGSPLDLNGITSTAPAYNDPITIAITPSDTGLTTIEKTFYVYWYLHAIKGVNGSSLSLSFSKLVGTTDSNETLGYTLSYEKAVENTTFIGINPAANDNSASVAKDATENSEIKLINGNSTTGLSKGFIEFTVDPIEYSSVSAQAYTANLALTITAP